MMSDAVLDRMYEAETDRLIEEKFGTQRKAAHVVEALRDVEIALQSIRKCRDWLDNAIAEDVPAELENEIGEFYEEADDLTFRLDSALDKWKERRFE